MHDLADRLKRAIREREFLEQHFERAAIAFVRELALEHVESELTLKGSILRRRNELELCLAIDESTDQPSAGHSVDENSGARHPGSAAKGRRVGLRRSRARPNLGRLDPLRDSANRFLRHTSTRRLEKIDCDNCGKTLSQAREVVLRPRRTLTSRVAISPTEPAPQLARGVG